MRPSSSGVPDPRIPEHKQPNARHPGKLQSNEMRLTETLNTQVSKLVCCVIQWDHTVINPKSGRYGSSFASVFAPLTAYKVSFGA